MGDDHLPQPPAPKPDPNVTQADAVTDFLACKTKTLTVTPRADWLTFVTIFNAATFERDGGKPFIKVTAGGVEQSLPTSVKNGKLHVETRAVQGAKPFSKKFKDKAEEIKDFVDNVNGRLQKNGHQFGGVTVKNGDLVLTKAALPAPGKAEKPDDKEHGKAIKGGPFPHVPTWEKVGAGGLLGLAVLFGIGFMNAGDETEIRTETACPEPGGPGESVSAGIDCPEPTPDPEPVPPQVPPRSEGLAEQVGDVIIGIEGGRQAPGTVTPTKVGRLNLVLPLFAIGENHRVELRDAQGNVVDAFAFTVPAASGPMPSITTEQDGTAECTTDHENPVPPGASGEMCLYVQPEVVTAPPADDSAPPPAGGDGNAVTEEVTETSEGDPWSLLVIPGAVLGVGGALVLEEERRRRLGGWDPTTGTYPDWETTGTYPDWSTTQVPDGESEPAGTPDGPHLPQAPQPPAPYSNPHDLLGGDPTHAKPTAEDGPGEGPGTDWPNPFKDVGDREYDFEDDYLGEEAAKKLPPADPGDLLGGDPKSPPKGK